MFSIYTSKGYAGDLVDSGPRTVQTGVVEGISLDFGVAVKRGTLSTNPKHVLAGHVAGNVFALTQREWNHEASTRPSDGTTVYNQTESASLIRQGYLYVLVTERSATAGALANINDTTGAISGGIAVAGETSSINVTFEENGLVGDIIKARIDIVA